MSKDKIKLEEFLKYIDLDTYVELYNGDTSVTGLEYEGILRDLIDNKELHQKHLEMFVESEGVSIDPPGVLCILMSDIL